MREPTPRDRWIQLVLAVLLLAPLLAAFWGTGGFEKLTGHIVGELDAQDPHNTIVNDIRLAARNAHGKVEYSATFTLLKPVDMAKASGVLLYEVPNRGNSPLNGRLSPDDLNAGHVLLSSGWQGDVEQRAPLESITVPVAKNADGSSIIGAVLARLMNLPAGSNTASLTGGFTGCGNPENQRFAPAT